MMLPIFGYTQESEFPFQVLDAENATFLDGRIVKRFDKVPLNETLRCKKNGYVLLVHITGIVLDISGDSSVVIRELADKLPITKMPVGPELERLFSDKRLLRAVFVTLETPPFFFPFTDLRIVYLHDEEDLCLKWRETGERVDTIYLLDPYDEVVNKLPAVGNETRISNAEWKKAMDPTTKFFQVELHHRNLAQFGVISFRSSITLGLFTCKVGSAGQALMIGYYQEICGELEEAERYHKMAMQMSDRPVFKEAYDWFLKRRAAR